MEDFACFYEPVTAQSSTEDGRLSYLESDKSESIAVLAAMLRLWVFHLPTTLGQPKPNATLQHLLLPACLLCCEAPVDQSLLRA